MKTEINLVADNIPVLVRRITLPCMRVQFVSVFYSIVDRMFIGHIEGAGALALAGVGVCGPIVAMVGAFAFLIGIGGVPLASMNLGAGRKRHTGNILANCFLMRCVISVAVTAVLIFIRRPMLAAFGAGGGMHIYAEQYFTVYIAGTVLALLISGMNQFIIC